jgi:hypothetical protein
MKEVHNLDRRDLLRWGMDLKNEAFLKDYWEARDFFEGGGQMRGAMERAILFQLAFKHRNTAEKSTTDPIVETVKPKKALQPA